MEELIASLIGSLSSSGQAPALGDWVTKGFNQSTAGKALNAFSQPDATMSSVYEAAQPKVMPTQQSSIVQAPALQQGVIGAQQPTYTQNQYLGGIPSLLQGYGNSSQGLLPFIGAR